MDCWKTKIILMSFIYSILCLQCISCIWCTKFHVFDHGVWKPYPFIHVHCAVFGDPFIYWIKIQNSSSTSIYICYIN